MLEFFQNLPQQINPIAFSIGFFDVRWYSLMYLVSFLVVGLLIKWRVYKKEADLEWKLIFDFLTYSFLCSLIGGRLGYVVFYNLSYFLTNPLEIFLPIKITGEFTGFYGMSYFGAVIGFVFVSWFFAKKRKIDLWKLVDFIMPAIPAGYFFGRIGNFLNGELYGRVTEKWWGMSFGDGLLRHPSQLYEAFFEGIVLFVILWILRNKFENKKGIITGLYLVGYGVVRFVIEFWREPDMHLGFVLGSLTLGQVFAVSMAVVGTIVIYKKLYITISRS